jgi:CheY-like chemotaxis protein
VVEDEEVLRRMAFRMLTALGYDVALAGDGVEALEYYDGHRGEIDLVVLDLNMPRMGGHECFMKLQEIDADLRAVVSTGYGANGEISDLTERGLLGVVHKPYEAAQLSDAVARALSHVSATDGA